MNFPLSISPRKEIGDCTRQRKQSLTLVGMKPTTRDGAMVEHLPPMQASHQCSSGSIPGLGIICGLSLLLVLVLVLRGFSPGTPVFPSPQKPTFPNSNWLWKAPRGTSQLNTYLFNLQIWSVLSLSCPVSHFLTSLSTTTYSCFDKGCPTEKYQSVRDNTERRAGLWLFTVASSCSQVFNAIEGGAMNTSLHVLKET